jgi:hypothetical protein
MTIERLDEKDIYKSLMKMSGMDVPDMNIDSMTRKILHLSSMIEATLELLVVHGVASPEEISDMIGRRMAVIASSPEMMSRCLGATFVAPFEKPEEVTRIGKESERTQG